MKIYICNSFSINMLSSGSAHRIRFVPLDREHVLDLLSYGFADFISAIGHKDTASIVSSDLNLDINQNRINVSLTEGDILIVAQYTGPRLKEGAVDLPEGASITYWLVEHQ